MAEVVAQCVFQKPMLLGDRLSQRLRRVLLLSQGLYHKELWKTSQCTGQSSTAPAPKALSITQHRIQSLEVVELPFVWLGYGPSTPLSWPILSLLALWYTLLIPIEWREKHLSSWLIETAWAVIIYDKAWPWSKRLTVALIFAMPSPWPEMGRIPDSTVSWLPLHLSYVKENTASKRWVTRCLTIYESKY